MEKEIKYKGKVITKKHPSGMFEYYSDKQKRFLKFDKLESAKSSIDKESKEDVRESVKAKTKKITLTELRSLVKNIVKEEQSKKKRVIKESKEDLIDFIVPQYYASALINGDFSGLESDDEQKLNSFIDDVQRKFGNANFMLGDEEDMDLGFMSRSDIDNLGGEMMRLFINPSVSVEENFDTRPAVDQDYIEIETPLNSRDYKIFNAISKNGFKLSKFGERNYDSIGKKAYFNFHKSEKNLLLNRLHKLQNKYNLEEIQTWIENIENYDSMQESVKPKTQKIKLSEVRQLVRKMIKEETGDPKSWGVGSFGVTKDVDLGEKPFEALDSSLKNTENLLKRVLNLSNKFNIGYAGNGHFEKQVVNQIMRKVRNDINKVSDKLIEDVLFYMEDHYDF